MHRLAVIGTCALAVAALLASSALPAHGQPSSSPSVAPVFAQLDLGVAGDPTDDCIYLQFAAHAVGPGDIRLVSCRGNAPGTWVRDNDTVERGGTAVSLTASYADANNDGRYDAGDGVYLDAGAAPGLSLGPGGLAIRLRPLDGMPAGSFVHANDPDAISFGANTVNFPTPSVAWSDRDSPPGYDAGDPAYLLAQQAPGSPAGRMFPLGALRVTADNPAGPFGSQVGWPTNESAPSTPSSSSPPTSRPSTPSSATGPASPPPSSRVSPPPTASGSSSPSRLAPSPEAPGTSSGSQRVAGLSPVFLAMGLAAAAFLLQRKR